MMGTYDAEKKEHLTGQGLSLPAPAKIQGAEGSTKSLPQPRMGHFIAQHTRLCHVDQQFAEILGFKAPDQLIGKPLADYVHPDDRDCLDLKKVVPTLASYDGNDTMRIITGNGQTRHVSIQGVCTQYQGEPAFEGFIIDLDAACEVRTAMIRYWTMINHIEDVVGEVDLKGNITYYNAAAVKYWGAYCLGGEARRLLNYKEYTEAPEMDYVRKAYLEVYYSGKPKKNIQYDIVSNDGRRRCVDDSVTPIRDDSGKITGYRTVSRNISALKRIEEKSAVHRNHLEAIFRSVRDAIITVAPDGRVINANQSAGRICGIDIKKAVGQPFPQCMPQCSKSCTEVLEKTLKKGKSVKEYSVECRLSEKNRQAVSVSSTPLLDAKGRIMGTVLVMRDITRLLDLEQEMRERHQYHNIIGTSKKMQKIFELVENLADLETTVLISGDSGTGKELIARALHFGGPRSAKPFIAVNCSALAENLLESELFGHVKGAFTGAFQDKTGRFQSADGGTILLDEISDISPLIQLKLLRVIQEKTFEKVGEAVSRKVDVRIIACTNKDLKQQVQNGLFREDLYYRLKVVEIDLPPLRQRIEDIPILVRHFCHLFNRRFNRTVEDVSTDAMALLSSYHWPGNVRELEHVIERAFVLCHGRIITVDHLPSEIRQLSLTETMFPTGWQPKDQTALQILNALNKSLWNKSKAAEMLGISRQTLYRKINTYNLMEKV